MAFGTSGVGSLKRKSETPPVTPGYNLASSSDSNIRAQSDESHSMKLKIKVNNTFCDGTFVLTTCYGHQRRFSGLLSKDIYEWALYFNRTNQFFSKVTLMGKFL